MPATCRSKDLHDAVKSVASLKHVYEMDDFPKPGKCDVPPVTDPDNVFYLAFTDLLRDDQSI